MFSAKEWMNRLMDGGFANKSTKIGVFTNNKWSKSIMTCGSYKIDDDLVLSVNNGIKDCCWCDFVAYLLVKLKRRKAIFTTVFVRWTLVW